MIRGTCTKNIVINVHRTSSGSSSSSSESHTLSNTCYNTIRTAWLGKVQRGDDSRTDKIIDDCLNI